MAEDSAKDKGKRKQGHPGSRDRRVLSAWRRPSISGSVAFALRWSRRPVSATILPGPRDGREAAPHFLPKPTANSAGPIMMEPSW